MQIKHRHRTSSKNRRGCGQDIYSKERKTTTVREGQRGIRREKRLKLLANGVERKLKKFKKENYSAGSDISVWLSLGREERAARTLYKER